MIASAIVESRECSHVYVPEAVYLGNKSSIRKFVFYSDINELMNIFEV